MSDIKICTICKRNPIEHGTTSTMCLECQYVMRELKGKLRHQKNVEAKGDRYLDKGGYVYVLVNDKYVSEHRFIMSTKLGRPLQKSESVHHINGVRDDNRPENLELWIQPQPGGIRAIDLICPHCGRPYLETDRNRE